ncbi:hypothetical protein [Candidatus Endomicrobiellum trichonymphae]|uniref:hypothetical protein n=1 Tax=Endomicrobium trichonymphae TaxID=1408204 RepID=UPI0039B9A8C7
MVSVQSVPLTIPLKLDKVVIKWMVTVYLVHKIAVYWFDAMLSLTRICVNRFLKRGLRLKKVMAGLRVV